MKVELLLNDYNRQVLHISEGITETQANLTLAREITSQHDTCEPWRQHEWQQFTTRSKSWAGSYLTLVPSSMRMPRRTHHGWPKHYPIVHPWSKIRYRPTRQHTKLLSLGIPYIRYALVHFNGMLIRTQPPWAWIDTGGCYHFRAPNLWSRPLSTFPFSILYFPQIALPGHQLCQPFDHLAKAQRTSIDRKGPIVSGFQPLVFCR
jgi:hypothetical protein